MAEGATEFTPLSKTDRLKSFFNRKKPLAQVEPSEAQTDSPSNFQQTKGFSTSSENSSTQHDNNSENDSPKNKLRKIRVFGESFKITDLDTAQAGRIVLLQDGERKNYLIDVTDRFETNQTEQSLQKRKAIKDFYPDFENPEFNNLSGGNNGLIVTITDQLNPDGKKRIYLSHLGQRDPNLTGIGSFPEIAILQELNFKDLGHDLYVPFSSVEEKADELFAQELEAARSEINSSADNLPEIADSNTLDTKFEIKS